MPRRRKFDKRGIMKRICNIVCLMQNILCRFRPYGTNQGWKKLALLRFYEMTMGLVKNLRKGVTGKSEF